ncbi:hypothetical protein E4U36_006875 [Claviceps purpurea]|nr:hypothetical protein E4U36_006875 [Claviceps purpurea]
METGVPPTLAVGLGVAKPAGRGVNVFLRIGEDPSRVEYHLALPIRDVESVEVEGDADCQLVYERVLVCLLLRGNVFVVEHLVDMALTYPVMNLKLLVTALEHPSMTLQHPKMASEHGGRQFDKRVKIPNIKLRDQISSASNNTNIGCYIEG